MSKITKKVNRGLPPNSRTQNFTQADAGADDVLMIEDSLGHCARNVTIETDAELQIRFNVYHTIFPKRSQYDSPADFYGGLEVLSSGQEYKDETMGIVSLEADSIYEINGDFPVRDIELLTVSGNFDIFVS
jgi:hypothetical protein